MRTYLKTKDFFLTKEDFELILNDELDLLITSPKPEEDDLKRYYQSEAYLSHSDRNRNLIEIIYSVVKIYLSNKKLRLINSFDVKEKSLLDIGCGTGDFLKRCQRSGWEVTGLEPDENARKKALTKLREKTQLASDIRIFFEGASRLDNEAVCQFDVITLWHVLEHVYDIDSYLVKLEKLLKRNGFLVIAVPNYKSYDAHIYREYWAGFDVPRHLWHFSKKAICSLFSRVSMEVIRIIPMKWDAFYVSILSEFYKSKKSRKTNFTILMKAVISGWKSNSKARKTGEYSSLIYIIKKRDDIKLY